MTEITNSVEKDIVGGLPYKFRCRWFGKYDEEFNGVSPVGLNKSENDLTAYDGLDYTKETVISPNAIRVGNPTISSDLVASGFSATKFFQLPTAFNPGSDRWEMYFKVKTGSTSSSLAIPFHSCFSSGASGRFGLAFGIKSGKTFMDISNNGTSWLVSDSTTGTYTYTANAWYWLKIGWNGTEYYIDYSTDGVTYTRDYTFSSSSSVYSSLTRTYIGIYSASSLSNQWTGSIDLSECYIKTSSPYFPDTWTTVWEGSNYQGTIIDFSGTKLPWKWGYQSMLKTSKYAVGALNQFYNFYGNIINLTVTGIPTVNTDRLASGFSTSNYLSKSLSSFGSSWDIYLKFKTSSSTVSGGQKILSVGTQNSEYKYALIFLNNAGTTLYAKTSNDGSTLVLTGEAQLTISNNTTYYVKIGSDGTKSYAYYSTTGFDDMTLLEEVNTPTTIPATTLYLGYETYYTTKGAFGGSIDLGESYVTVNGDEVWRGFDKTVLDGCINGDTDSQGKYYCYAINGDDHVELRKKTGSIILAYNTTPRYLGEVLASAVYVGWYSPPGQETPIV